LPFFYSPMNDRIHKLQEFLQQSPGDLFLNHALALEYIKAGQETEAHQLFEKNLATNENYVATYYHLGKLLERAGKVTEALAIYERGMQVARSAKDNHSYNELQAAYEDLADL
jgi:tetratricopeptide (TPR) repeat protein